MFRTYLRSSEGLRALVRSSFSIFNELDLKKVQEIYLDIEGKSEEGEFRPPLIQLYKYNNTYTLHYLSVGTHDEKIIFTCSHVDIGLLEHAIKDIMHDDKDFIPCEISVHAGEFCKIQKI